MSEIVFSRARLRFGALALAVALSMAAGAALAARSERTVVFLDYARSSFWHTATNSSIRLPIVYPEGASSATLTVEGAGYSASYPAVAEGEFVLSLPAADGPQSENVYRLALVFDNDTTNSAVLGVVQGVGDAGAGSSRCVLPEDGKSWCRFQTRAVLPVPHGVSSVMVDGEPVDTGLGGDQGWFALGPYAPGNEGIAVSIEDGAGIWNATLIPGVPGLLLLLR